MKAPPFGGSQLLLARHSGLDSGVLSRVLREEREPTSEFLGRLCGTLPAEDAACLLTAFLNDLLVKTAEAQPKSKRLKTWRRPLSNLEIRVNCSVR